MNRPLYTATIKDRWQETKAGSTKSTFHLILDTSHLSLSYKVGDSVAIHAPNDPLLVERLLQALHTHDPTVRHALSTKNLSKVTSTLAHLFHAPLLPHLDVLDLAEQFGRPGLDLPAILKALLPLLPRFYSIASSPQLYPQELHLLVALTSFQHSTETRYGVASHFLCHRSHLHTTPISFHIQPTPHFTLPSSNTFPIIMVGPGTGVAPFRAFLQERLHLNAPGKNWLFFGERNQKTDFFYEPFWISLTEAQKLTLDLAFSRDTPEKVYVQHKLIEKGAHVWEWLQNQATFYVCGDADPMAKEVEQAVLHIATTHGNLSPNEAKLFIKTLRREKRYLADVY